MNIRNDEILEVVCKVLTPAQVNQSLISWYKKVLPEGTPLKAGQQAFAMPFEGTLVFVDLAPRANWAHPCFIMLIDTRTFDMRVIDASFPPNIDQSDKSFIVLLRYGKKPQG
jgi:hypothetical protein